MRVDKYLWCVRLFKTRSLATKACNVGSVQTLEDGKKLKPGRETFVGMKLKIDLGHQVRIIEIKDLPASRVGAPLVNDYMIDHTPPPEPEDPSQPQRDRGAGRPSKRDRRDIQRLLGED